jgi:cyclopropane fatty-acyl-phospholipid synthase-like methyltransferase
MIQWSEDDQLWASMAPALSKPERYSQARKDVELIETSLQLRSDTAVLDLGCGAGVHAIAFASHGYKVTAVDQSKCLLSLAIDCAAKNNLSIEFIRDDMRQFVRPCAYDLVCSLYSSFAYFDDTVNVRVAENIHRSLRPGGDFMLDTIGERHFVECGEVFTNVNINGSVYSCHRSFDTQRSLLCELWTVICDGKSQQFSTKQRFY